MPFHSDFKPPSFTAAYAVSVYPSPENRAPPSPPVGVGDVFFDFENETAIATSPFPTPKLLCISVFTASMGCVIVAASSPETTAHDANTPSSPSRAYKSGCSTRTQSRDTGTKHRYPHE